MRLLLLTLIPFGLFAQVPPANLHNEDLRIWLKANWFDGEFSDLGYNDAREQMYGACENVGGQIECVYTGFQQAASFTTFPNPISAEHLVPQSYYGAVSPMRSDIHNMRPCHESANSARGNNLYAEISDGSATWYGVDGQGDFATSTSIPGNPDDYSERFLSFWEPREGQKGDIARAVFYFYTMYPTQAGDISLLGAVNTFYQWHLDDPVSAFEVSRNTCVENAQGNRNPYVDYPELVYDAWLWVALDGCTNAAACNYDAAASNDDGSCALPGDPCDDGDGSTTGEVYQSDCSCAVNSTAGCTDPFACNYDPNATVFDGSCEFISCAGCMDPAACNFDPAATLADACDYACDGCTDSGACNYNATATNDDGSCEYVTCAGCTDPTACNYDANATIDDGNCDLVSCYGCTSIFACNYNATATNDDGSCTYPGDPCDDGNPLTNGEALDVNCMCQAAEVLGCTYGIADNYDPLATTDDGTCVFTDCGGPCTPGDLSGDDLVGTADLLLLLGEFGFMCPQ